MQLDLLDVMAKTLTLTADQATKFEERREALLARRRKD